MDEWHVHLKVGRVMLLPIILTNTAHPVLLKNSTRSQPQGRNAGYTSGMRIVRKRLHSFLLGGIAALVTALTVGCG
ncbi:MAG TPA: hypothetical protein VF772_08635, partial [Terriglobales bacterium]